MLYVGGGGGGGGTPAIPVTVIVRPCQYFLPQVQPDIAGLSLRHLPLARSHLHRPRGHQQPGQEGGDRGDHHDDHANDDDPDDHHDTQVATTCIYQHSQTQFWFVSESFTMLSSSQTIPRSAMSSVTSGSPWPGWVKPSST